jgi:hypothetical protein
MNILFKHKNGRATYCYYVDAPISSDILGRWSRRVFTSGSTSETFAAVCDATDGVLDSLLDDSKFEHKAIRYEPIEE